MKQILLVLFLFCVILFFPNTAFATISFTINNPIQEGDYFIVDASLSGISSTSAFVQGMFTATNSTSYFGYTWGQNEEWVNYVGNTNKDFITQNFPILQRNVSQKIWVRPNYQDPAYKGPGEYFLKLKRYTGASDNSTGDDAVLTVLLTELLPTPEPTITDEITNTPEPTTESTWTPNPTKTPTPTPKPTKIQATSTITIALTNSILSSSSATMSAVLGDSTDSAQTVGFEEISDSSASSETKPKLHINDKIFFFIGLSVAVSAGSILYFRHRKD